MPCLTGTCHAMLTEYLWETCFFFFIFKGNQGGVDLQESRIGESKEEKRDVKLWSEYEGRISK